MIYVVAAIVAVAAFGLVGYPLFQRRELELAPEAVDLDLEDANSRREAVYGAIKELDFEYQLGNLSDADYQSLRSQYRQRAASVLMELDELTEERQAQPAVEIERDLDAEIEEAVRQVRANANKPPARPVERTSLCSSCGARVGKNSRFCPSCGADLATPVAKSCAECGVGLEPEDKFCPACGYRLQARRRK
ncbi:MAG: zinc ribbon domain-containing protein [Dehalococcoidia bacterium]|nr:zinc ribbon domain-containing protein [Dehalococcoidia bacterium]